MNFKNKLARLTKGLKKVGRFAEKKLDTKYKRVNVIPSTANKVVIVENQPVALTDRSRFFNETFQEDRRQLFFT